MSGVLVVLDKLGRALAEAEQEIARLRQENEILRQQTEASGSKLTS